MRYRTSQKKLEIPFVVGYHPCRGVPKWGSFFRGFLLEDKSLQATHVLNLLQKSRPGEQKVMLLQKGRKTL